MSHRTVRAAIAAVAGTTVGVGAVVVATTASASSTVTAGQSQAAGQADAASSLPICDSWSDRKEPSINGRAVISHIPSAGQGSNNFQCMLGQNPNNVYGGVYKLQTALVKCYGQNIDIDGRFGQHTADALANVQRPKNLTPLGVYTPFTGAAMVWPTYFVSDGSATGKCNGNLA